MIRFQREREGTRVGWKPGSRGQSVPSTRIRCLEPLAELRARRYPVELYRHSHRSGYRVVVFQKAYDPRHLNLARELQARGVVTVFDLSDNLFYNPLKNSRVAERAGWLSAMVDAVDVVTVSTAALRDLLPRPTELVRDGLLPLDPTLRMGECDDGAPGAVRDTCELGWFGTWGGSQAPAGMRDLLRIRGLLEDLHRDYPLRLNVFSNSRRFFDETIRPFPCPTRYWEWGNPSRFYQLFSRMDVCVLPIEPNEFTWYKSPNRLALALHLSIPAVADEIPSYREFGDYCRLGQWGESLREYLRDPARARAEAGRGQEYVAAHYLTEHAASEWGGLFDRLGARKSG